MGIELDATATADVIEEVMGERRRQHERWGEQNWPDGTGSCDDEHRLTDATLDYEIASAGGVILWRHILAEEVAEVFAAVDQVRLRAELIQVAAVAVQWVEAIDRRSR